MPHPGARFPQPFQEWPHVGQQWPAYNVESDQADGLLAWWPTVAGYLGANILRDLAGQGYDGTGAVWITDAQHGTVLDFDGAGGGLVNCGSPAGLDDLHAGAFSFTAWIYPTATGDGFINKSTGATVGPEFVVRSNNRLEGYIYTDDVTGDSYSTTNDLPLNTWHSVVMTYDHNGDRLIRLYIDGVEVTYGSQVAATGSPDSDAAQNFYIGRGRYGFFTGRVGDPRIYSRVLTPTQCWELFDPATRWELPQIPRRLWRLGVIAPPPATIVPIAMYHYRSMRV